MKSNDLITQTSRTLEFVLNRSLLKFVVTMQFRVKSFCSIQKKRGRKCERIESIVEANKLAKI